MLWINAKERQLHILSNVKMQSKYNLLGSIQTSSQQSHKNKHNFRQTKQSNVIQQSNFVA